jgi:hypothetical protein
VTHRESWSDKSIPSNYAHWWRNWGSDLGSCTCQWISVSDPAAVNLDCSKIDEEVVVSNLQLQKRASTLSMDV